MSDFSTLGQAVSDLKRFYGITGRDALLREAVTAEQKDISTQSFIMSQVMDIVDGGRRVSQIIEAFEQFTGGEGDTKVTLDDLKELVAIYYDSDSDFVKRGNVEETIQAMVGSVNGTEKEPPKEDASVAIIQVLPVDITPANRFTDASTLLLTAIPSVEFSRAVPYLDVKFILPRPPLDRQNKPLGSTLFKFLIGRTPVSEGEANIINAGGIKTGQVFVPPVGSPENQEPTPEIFSTSGMELFTAPQTLVNANEGFDQNTGTRHAPVIDRFRPLMTFKSLEFTVVPTVGMMSYKSAKMQFVLHDRSRLGEIADLIRPDLYGNVEMLIEYGWSHPDGSTGVNPYGALLNATRVREKYGIMNSSFTFGEAGQVDITLDIFMKGVTDFSTTQITQSKEVSSLMEEVEKLIEAVSLAKSSSGSGTKEVRGSTILKSPSDISAALSMDAKTKREIQAYINQYKNKEVTPDKKALLKTLTDLYGQTGGKTEGKIEVLRETLDGVFKARKESLKSGPDFPLDRLDDETKKADSFGDVNDYVSLAKIFLRFVAEPLAATGRFDEIQMLFYTFNSGAGKVRHTNIGSFPINASTFTKQLQAYVTERGTTNLSINEFVTYVSNNYIDNQANPAYGFAGKGVPSGEFDKGEIQPLDEAEQTALKRNIEQRIEEMNLEGGTFRMPQVDLYVEALPQGKNLSDESEIGDDSVTLLRIHVFDKHSTPYMALQSLLDAMLDRNLGTFAETDSPDDDKSKHKENAAKIRDLAVSASLIEKIDSS
ncbi:MAG: hypothetical protein ACW96N_00475, partial [Candidatus Thorarchaeota archaeon]